MGVLCTWVKLFTDLQILGCELHTNAFGGLDLAGPAGGAISLRRDRLPPLYLTSDYRPETLSQLSPASGYTPGDWGKNSTLRQFDAKHGMWTDRQTDKLPLAIYMG